ncbi:MAG: hydrogenase maturation protein [Magnetococcales bacterium]|nr:hydrogenase maturation protein [Magnetococcales bacterium]
MRILLLVHAFNSLSQRVFVELTRRGDVLSVELDISDRTTEEAVARFRPDLVIAPFLKRAIPESVWRAVPCWILHPGPPGDRGPSALDWAVQEGIESWGVTVLQAEAVLDAGPVWGWAPCSLARPASKGSLYRHEVTEAALTALHQALDRFAAGGRPTPQAEMALLGTLHPPMTQAQRRIDWNGSTREALARLRAADGFPGVADELLGLPCRLFDPWEEATLRGPPGAVIARREGAICRATGDGAVWVGHLRLEQGEPAFKLPATVVLGEERLAGVPEVPLSWRVEPGEGATWRDLAYREENGIGWLEFPFANGAMDADQCERLRQAVAGAAQRSIRALVLLGGVDFFSNGLHLNRIEAAASPAEESWRNIRAMNRLVRQILDSDHLLTVAAVRGNAGAGGCFLALAADRVVCRGGVTMNPHYRNMGNLYGSEYWTALLPRRCGTERAEGILRGRLPLGAAEAAALGLADRVLSNGLGEFQRELEAFVQALVGAGWEQALAEKRQRRLELTDEQLDACEAAELGRMRINFYGFDPSYHVARYEFVHKVRPSRTPLHLAIHRR